MKAKVAPAPGEPLRIKSGNVTVKIYIGENRVNGVAYPQFTLAYYDGAKRIKKKFADCRVVFKSGILCANKSGLG